MGNATSFIKGHGKRLINRYNAQYRALRFLDREKLATAPRHEVPLEFQKVTGSTSVHDFQKKDLELDEYLKNVYVHSNDTMLESSSKSDFKNSLRPLPENRESKEDYFIEPTEIEKGFCTITQISTFLANHEEDPENNTPEAIAKNYNLDIEKVETILKYHCVFKSNEPATKTDEVKAHDENINEEQEYIFELKNQEKAILNYYESVKAGTKRIEGEKLEREKKEDKNDELNRKAVSSK